MDRRRDLQFKELGDRVEFALRDENDWRDRHARLFAIRDRAYEAQRMALQRKKAEQEVA